MRILYLEPFDGGSHADFTRLLTTRTPFQWTALTLPGRHWKWRMRGSAMWFATAHAEALSEPYDLVVAGSFLPLAELKGLAPALSATPSILYFHENQLAYPVREEFSGRRDHHFGFTQLVSALSATVCAFNSAFNRDSFLAQGRDLVRRMPDAASTGWIDAIEARSRVLPVPVDLPDLKPEAIADRPLQARAGGPTILWNHRWEFDKNPEAFFDALRHLIDREVPFSLVVCGERYRKAPPVFEEARAWLGDRVAHWGFAPSRRRYLELLADAHIAVSTANHEFFGVAMIEAAHFGAFPLVPDRLAYPERFPAPFRYAGDAALPQALERLCRGWMAGELDLRQARPELTGDVVAERALRRYTDLFEEVGELAPSR